MINSQDSFVTSDESKLLLSLLRKEQLSEEQWEKILLMGIQKRKTMKNGKKKFKKLKKASRELLIF